MRQSLLLVLAVLAGLAPRVAFGDAHAFPSSASAVTATVGQIDADEVGWFFSSTLDHGVAEAFADPYPEVGRAVFDLTVPQNTLTTTPVHWNVLINTVQVGQFEVAPGETGPVHLDWTFAPIAAIAGEYTVALEVSADVPLLEGAHTLGYADPNASTVTLLPEPATLGLVAAGCLVLWRRAAGRGH